jgi:N-acetylmuramoyl-L-alanine amidase
MSNPGEAAKLKTPEYQTKLACALTAAYLQFAGGASPA